MSLEFTWRVSAELGDTRRARDWGWLGEASWRPAHRTGLHSHHHPTHTVSHRQFVSSFVTQFFLVTTGHILSHIFTIIHHQTHTVFHRQFVSRPLWHNSYILSQLVKYCHIILQFSSAPPGLTILTLHIVTYCKHIVTYCKHIVTYCRHIVTYCKHIVTYCHIL